MEEDREFRETTIRILTDVQTKMNFLVGSDGTNGRFSEVCEDVDSLKQSRARQWGAIALASFIWTAALGTWEALKGK